MEFNGSFLFQSLVGGVLFLLCRHYFEFFDVGLPIFLQSMRPTHIFFQNSLLGIFSI